MIIRMNLSERIHTDIGYGSYATSNCLYVQPFIRFHCSLIISLFHNN